MQISIAHFDIDIISFEQLIEIITSSPRRKLVDCGAEKTSYNINLYDN